MTPTKPRNSEKSKETVARLRRLLIHPLTAGMLAFAAFRVVSIFDLISFPFAPLIAAAVAFGGTLLLSRKYDPLLSCIFLVLALVIFFKAAAVRKTVPMVPPLEDLAVIKLHVLAALVKDASLRLDTLPATLPEMETKTLAGDRFTFGYCAGDSCVGSLASGSNAPDVFWIWATPLKGDDKPSPVWYIDESFQIYTAGPDGRMDPWQAKGVL